MRGSECEVLPVLFNVIVVSSWALAVVAAPLSSDNFPASRFQPPPQSGKRSFAPRATDSTLE